MATASDDPAAAATIQRHRPLHTLPGRLTQESCGSRDGRPPAGSVRQAQDVRGRGRILVISCYELGHLPHGLAVLCGFLERAGFAPACVDVSVESLSDAAIDRALLVCVSVPMHTALRLGTHLAKRIRARNPNAWMCFFGTYAALNAEYLQTLGVSWALAGECEEALVELAENLARGRIPGPIGRTVLAKLHSPRPSRSGLPDLARYAHLNTGSGDMRVTGYTETSRGCRDMCRHCPLPAVYGGRFFVFDAGTVLDDIATQVAAGAEHITFGDPDFFNGPRHGMAILRDMHRRWPHVTFDVTTQIQHLQKHRGYVSELAELGCAFVVSAVESLSDRVLAALRKRHRRADVLEVAKLCQNAGLILRPTFVVFTPWTTLADVCELLDFIVLEDLVCNVDPVQLAIRLLVPPGSLLLSASDTRACFGSLDPAALTHQWSHPDQRVDALGEEFSRITAQAVETNADPATVIASLRERAYRAAGRPVPSWIHRAQKHVPRLTEPWFC